MRRLIHLFLGFFTVVACRGAGAFPPGTPGSPTSWGNGAGYSLVIPPDLRNPIQLATAGYQYYVLQADGRVRLLSEVFYNDFKPPASATNVTQISALGYHVLALRADGTVVVWGSATDVDQRAIITPPLGLSNVVAIAAGYRHSLVLKSDGSLVTWGADNQSGVLDIPTGLSNIVSIAAGQSISGVVLEDGSVRIWGDLSSHGFINQTPGTSGAVKQIAFGTAQTVFLRTNGTVLTRKGALAPAGVNQPTSLTNVVSVRAGWGQIAAIKADGTVAMWGANDQNQAVVPSDINGVVDIGCPYLLTVALTRKPMLLSSNSTIYVMAGDPLHIEAQPVFDDTYQTFWSPYNPAASPTFSFTIPNAQENRSGVYSLTIVNEFGSATAPVAKVTVLPSLPRFTKVPPRIAQVQPGASLNLSGEAVGTDPITYQWRRIRNGAPAEIVSTSNSVALRNLFPEFDGEIQQYQLTATNPYGPTYAEPVAIEFLTSGRFFLPRVDFNSQAFLSYINIDPSRDYAIQTSDDLKTWSPYLTFRAATGTISIGENWSPYRGQRFYRLVTQTP